MVLRSAPMRLIALAFGLGLITGLAWMPPAFSQQQDNGAAEEPPAPDAGQTGQENQTGQDDQSGTEDLHARPDKSAPPAEIIRDVSLLPFPARRMHELLIEAAKSGNIEQLRQYIGSGDDFDDAVAGRA